ncbi:hypothetical protein [Yinghuangia soli]|uniref:Uncharacterized protein n=1 Tax=Yinghuangia soli TaxID=2908204 RepID=A0AA41Q2H0_9ACTN|nr:hypothetical protein [Yinghuangia soli]MCF2530344.1 hypothetical protein [Yinghuangia soli]
MDVDLQAQITELARQGAWDEAQTLAGKLILALESRPAARDRDTLLAEAYQTRSYVLAMTGNLEPAADDGRRALQILYGWDEPDDFMIASLLYSHVLHLAELGEMAEIRSLDRRPMAVFREALGALPGIADPTRAAAAGQVAGYAAGMHAAGEQVLACDCDREALAVFADCAEILDDGLWETYVTTALNLAASTPHAAEAKTVAADAVERVVDLLNAGRLDFLLSLVHALYLSGRAQRRLGEEDSLSAIVDAKYLLDTFRPTGPESEALSRAIGEVLAADQRSRGWFISPELARLSGEWLRAAKAR